MSEHAFSGAEYIETTQEEREEVATEIEVSPAETAGKGFANPETLARAQETRRRNKEANAPVDAPSDASPGAKRGRKPGAQVKPKRDLEGITSMLVGIHMMVASATGFMDIAIDQDEGAMLASALANISDQYKIKIDGKSSAFLGLIYALISVYGPRAYTISKQIKDRGTQENGRS